MRQDARREKRRLSPPQKIQPLLTCQPAKPCVEKKVRYYDSNAVVGDGSWDSDRQNYISKTSSPGYLPRWGCASAFFRCRWRTLATKFIDIFGKLQNISTSYKWKYNFLGLDGKYRIFMQAKIHGIEIRLKSTWKFAFLRVTRQIGTHAHRRIHNTLLNSKRKNELRSTNQKSDYSAVFVWIFHTNTAPSMHFQPLKCAMRTFIVNERERDIYTCQYVNMSIRYNYTTLRLHY